MAIPFNLPSDEETGENYRILDQLLFDLYNVLRQILLRRRAQRAHPPEPTPPQVEPEIVPPTPRQPPQAQLPDVVQSGPLARNPPVPPPRRRRRRSATDNKTHHGNQHCNVVHQPEPQQQSPSWLNVGIELREIAEEFRSTQPGGGVETRRKEIKASSLFSLLVPAPITGSIWTTVIILVGWRILARHR